ncbi:uncharacterized protein LOC126976317 [Leptidea sinapis]|uniref:uncharacterized protein LOC126976317 n=1 Tax=Leptidea sinapis TaxID=189913 RepID=UPI002125AE74|nr:uncharacterized protein LOC126976317 [Leptidea sinapis]
MVGRSWHILFGLLVVSVRVGSYDGEELVVSKDYGNLHLYGTLHQSVKKYERFADSIENGSLLLYGTNSWRFPVQDVNLTLQYPKENESYENRTIVTGITVILYLDGSTSRGYITRGGMMQNNITMTFVISRTTRLAYQFWLYGRNSC